MIPTEISDKLKLFFSNSKYIIVITIVCLIIAYASVAFLGKDNIVEQEIEKVIQIETGISLDLTP